MQNNLPSLFYKLSDFNIVAGNEFIQKIESLNSIQKISIVDVNIKENQFRVNDIIVFNDTLHTDNPNAYGYSKYATETNINKEKLHEVLTIFSQVKVSEFIRKNNFYLFPVEKYALAKQNGYLYSPSNNIKATDTLFIKEVYGDKIILKKKVGENWFEYESEK